MEMAVKQAGRSPFPYSRDDLLGRVVTSPFSDLPRKDQLRDCSDVIPTKLVCLNEMASQFSGDG
jgi:hypothetical protein